MSKTWILAASLAACSLPLLSITARAGLADIAEVDPLFPELGSISAPVAPDDRPGRGHAVGAGLATWYGPGFVGRRTASGERFDGAGMTAAHLSLPFGTRVRVEAESGRSVVVRINDRGPHRRGAVIDLSGAAARALGIGGTAHVRLTVVGQEG